ncbi:hypothetical protein [Nocardia sp. NRRL S-836]|uniref:hypothetical protein n=1 Tax=Nocardia sp. NRRL S-836 TaxID=1519492 RepID=UPI0006AFFAD8|nr:hypothetical protein [Nocardia sp. NRRL S-836]KOV86332.1 hypothetical protein ADL03_09335 [Nocardia sp. NRRL S-836]
MTEADGAYQELQTRYQALSAEHDELVRQMGDQIKPFPGAGVDGFLSHFIISLEVTQGDLAGTSVSFTMPPAAQTVSRSAPFVYRGPEEDHRVEVPLPADCTLSPTIAEGDFIVRPDSFFEPGNQVVWMQILNLDARMEHETIGPIRIILGETLKRDYPDVFQPSLGVARALGRKGGFPAALFFNPYAMIETQFGVFRAIHGTLAYGRVTSFPPIGTPVSIQDCVPLEDIEEVRRTRSLRGVDESIEPFGRIVALSHPIDVPMQLPGDEAFRFVERRIARTGSGAA